MHWDHQTYLSIVVPVYRSESCLTALVTAIGETLGPLGFTYEILLINDGSPDRSWQVIESLSVSNPAVIGVDLRRNFGQDNAILTGMRIATGKFIVIMDDDLQHDPRFLPDLLNEIERGYDVVFADFSKKHQRLWKNLGSWFNGKVAERVIQKPRDIYLSPYKIIRKEIAELVCAYDGPHPYVDGLIFQVTSRMSQIQVEHQPRYAGKSNYTFWRSVRVWGRLAFSFSIWPLRLLIGFGLTFAVLGMILALVVIAYRLVAPSDFPPSAVGWASLIVTVLVVGGVQLVFLGVLGEYVGRMFLKVNDRPQTAVRAVLNKEVPASEFTGLDRVAEGVQVGGESDL